MLTAKRLEGEFASGVAERRKAASLMRKVVRGWRGVVAHSGPARIEALAELRRARVAVAQLVGEAAGETTEWRAAARRRVRTAVARAVSQIDVKWEPLRTRACLAWALVHRVRQWRAMWLSKRGAGERPVRGSCQ